MIDIRHSDAQVTRPFGAQAAHTSAIDSPAVSMVAWTKAWKLPCGRLGSDLAQLGDVCYEIAFNRPVEKSNYAQNCSPVLEEKTTSNLMPASVCKSFVNPSLTVLSNNDQCVLLAGAGVTS